MTDEAAKARPKTRRAHAAIRREFRVTVMFSAGEMAKIKHATERSGQAVAAWIGQAAIDKADMRAIPASRALLDALQELQQATGLVRRAGRLLNQAVARLNTTGTPGPDLERAIAHTMRVMDRLNDAAQDVRETL